MPQNLFTHPIHLGTGATADPQPEFTGMDWYTDYEERTRKDGSEGRLVSLCRFDRSWDSWEMHPAGHEVVVCIAGEITLHQEHENRRSETIVLKTGDYAINPPGIWHTADVKGDATALFITAGAGTQHRPR